MRIKARMGISVDGYVVLPLVLGDGVPLWPRGTAQPRLRLRGQPRVFPDGSAELSYSTA